MKTIPLSMFLPSGATEPVSEHTPGPGVTCTSQVTHYDEWADKFEVRTRVINREGGPDSAMRETINSPLAGMVFGWDWEDPRDMVGVVVESVPGEPNRVAGKWITVEVPDYSTDSED